MLFKKWRQAALPVLAVSALALLWPATPVPAARHKTSHARAQPAAVVPVRLGAHDSYTRVVVDFTRRTAYRIEQRGGSITLTFDTPGSISAPADTEKFVTGLHAGKPNAGSAVLVIDTAAGTGFRDYRDGQKIVIDLFAAKKGAAKKTVSEKTAPEKPVAAKTAEKNPPEKTSPEKMASDKTVPPAAPALTKESLQKAINETLNASETLPEASQPAPSAQNDTAAPADKPKPQETQAEATKPADAKTADTPKADSATVPTKPATDTAAATAAPAANQAPAPATPPAAPNTDAVNAAVPAAVMPPAVAPKDAAAAPDSAKDTTKTAAKTNIVGPPQPPEDPTVISLTTVDPARLAVFKRFGTLWLVLDSQAAGAIMPSVTGPHAELLGLPKTMALPGGFSYRFALADDRPIAVEKKGFTWRVLLGGQQLEPPAAGVLRIETEEATHLAKIVAQLKDGSQSIEFQDPQSGEKLDVVATADPAQRIEEGRRYADLEVLPAVAGMVVRPLKDDVHVNRIEDFVLVTAPSGISATPNASAGPSAVIDENAHRDETRLFDFPNWRQGGILHLSRNAAELENRISRAKTPDERTALLMKLALLYFANNFGQEALGVIHIIEDESPEMVKNPNFLALRGAASAMAGHYAEALSDLSTPAIQNHAEVALWIGYAAAATEQWRMANRSFPADNYLLRQYPENIATPFTIYMAESALRLGHADTAKVLLASLDSMSGSFDAHSKAAVEYLKGEAARQAGDIKGAIQRWRPVAFGLDRLYHTKASLALANLELQEKTISLNEAIDRVDSLRFAWRGDGLEVQILQNLGALKIQNKKYLLGLEDMKSAANLADSLQGDGQPIRDDMGHIVSDLFIGGKAKDMPPLEAASVYKEFGSLMPKGQESALASISFVDNLINMDLLDNAEALLQQEIKDPAVPADKIPGLHNKLAAVYLLDGQPQQALDALAGDNTASEERALLKARALSELNQTDDAIAALAPLTSTDAKKLKADVLWRAKRWADAAAAIETLLPANPPTPPTPGDAQMIVNAAVAYKLAENNDGLNDIKKRYGAAMAATPLASTFGVVTRPIGKSALADRDTILKIAGEVDMFKDFLDAYKGNKGS